MKQEAATWVVLGGLGAVTVSVVIAGAQISGLDARLTEVLKAKEAPMQTLTETVTIGTRKITVSTVRNEGESLNDWIARHNDAVEALQE